MINPSLEGSGIQTYMFRELRLAYFMSPDLGSDPLPEFYSVHVIIYKNTLFHANLAVRAYAI